MKEQVLTSPFVSKEFLNLAYNFSDSDKQLLNNCVINNKVVSNAGNRDFVDYRPEIAFTNEELHRNSVEKVMLDSLHYFQIKDDTTVFGTVTSKVQSYQLLTAKYVLLLPVSQPR